MAASNGGTSYKRVENVAYGGTAQKFSKFDTAGATLKGNHKRNR